MSYYCHLTQSTFARWWQQFNWDTEHNKQSRTQND